MSTESSLLRIDSPGIDLEYLRLTLLKIVEDLGSKKLKDSIGEDLTVQGILWYVGGEDHGVRSYLIGKLLVREKDQVDLKKE